MYSHCLDICFYELICYDWIFLMYYPNKAFYFITSVCTVDLDMPYFLAAHLTVAPVWAIKSPTVTARSSGRPIICIHSVFPFYKKYERQAKNIQK